MPGSGPALGRTILVSHSEQGVTLSSSTAQGALRSGVWALREAPMVLAVR